MTHASRLNNENSILYICQCVTFIWLRPLKAASSANGSNWNPGNKIAPNSLVILLRQPGQVLRQAGLVCWPWYSKRDSGASRGHQVAMHTTATLLRMSGPSQKTEEKAYNIFLARSPRNNDPVYKQVHYQIRANTFQVHSRNPPTSTLQVLLPVFIYFWIQVLYRSEISQD